MAKKTLSSLRKKINIALISSLLLIVMVYFITIQKPQGYWHIDEGVSYDFPHGLMFEITETHLICYDYKGGGGLSLKQRQAYDPIPIEKKNNSYVVVHEHEGHPWNGELELYAAGLKLKLNGVSFHRSLGDGLLQVK